MVKAFDQAMQFLLPVVLVRCLDAATFGEYRLLWLSVGTLIGVGTLNMAGSLYFFLPRSDPERKRLYHPPCLVLPRRGGPRFAASPSARSTRCSPRRRAS
jgi:hypothetical protein